MEQNRNPPKLTHIASQLIFEKETNQFIEKAPFNERYWGKLDLCVLSSKQNPILHFTQH